MTEEPLAGGIMLAILKDLYVRFGSRKFLATVGFGGIIPIIFHQTGVSDSVTIAAIGLAAAYHASNVLDKKS